MPVPMQTCICTTARMTSTITRVESILPIPSSKLILSEGDMLLHAMTAVSAVTTVAAAVISCNKLDSSLSLPSLSSLCIKRKAHKARMIPYWRSRIKLQWQKDMMSWWWTTNMEQIKKDNYFDFLKFFPCVLFSSSWMCPREKLYLYLYLWEFL